jgi:glutamine synthetase adenylyltransferase
MSFDQKALAAMIAQREDSEARREHDHELQSLQIEISNLLKQKDQQIKLMEITGGPTGPDFHNYLDTLKSLDSDIKKVQGKMEQMKSQKRKSNPIVTSLLASLSSDELTKRSKTASTAGGETSSAPSAVVEVIRRSPTAMSTLSDDSAGVQGQNMQSDRDDLDDVVVVPVTLS